MKEAATEMGGGSVGAYMNMLRNPVSYSESFVKRSHSSKI